MSTGKRLRVRARQVPDYHNEVSSWSLFARLPPQVAQWLHAEALENNANQMRNFLDTKDGWTLSSSLHVSSSCESGIEFLPLSITLSSLEVVYVSYNGGSIANHDGPFFQAPTIELPASVLPDSTSNDDDVVVKVLPHVSDAPCIYVEPLECEDWELLETNSEFLERGGLLQQVSVVYPKQILPLWVGGRDCVRVTVLPHTFESKEWSGSDDDSSFEDVERRGSSCCLRLVADTEVIVTPKPRLSPSWTASTGISVPLRVYPTWDDWSRPMKQLQEEPVPMLNVPPLSLYGHPDTLHDLLPGWHQTTKFARELSRHQAVPLRSLAVVWRSNHENNDAGGRLLRNGEKENQEVAVVCVCESEDVPRGHIAMHTHVRYQIGVTPLYDHARLKLLSEDQVKSGPDAISHSLRNQTATLKLEKVWVGTNELATKMWRVPYGIDRTVPLFKNQSDSSARKSTSSEMNMSEMRSILASWLELPDANLEQPISPGSLISLPWEDGAATMAPGETVYRLAYRHTRIAHCPPSYVEHPLFILAKDLPSMLLQSNPADGEPPSEEEPEGDMSQIFTRNLLPIPPFEPLLNALPPTPDISNLEQSDQSFSTLSTQQSLLDVIGYVDTIVITGETGSGKTHSAVVLAARARRVKACPTVYMDCKNLQSSSGVRMKDILNELTELFETAIKMRPCVLILDDVDEIAPNMNADSGEDDNGSIHHQQVNPVAIDQAKLISDHIQNLIQDTRLTENQDPNRDLFSLSVILTCRHATSVSTSLIGGQTYPVFVAVPSFGGRERRQMFSRMLQDDADQESSQGTKPADFNLFDVVDPTFEKMTEGFRPRDLEVLSRRVHHKMHAASLHRDSVISDGAQPTHDDMSSPSINVSIWMDAVVESLQDFVPISRQSVGVEDTSSSAGWSEVGGLFHAKDKLSESILHPVKHSSIYKNAPIRLPRGILLHGPPGCGKSFLVPALAKECNFHLLTCHGPELLDKYIGASEAKVRQLFARAHAAAPCVLFLDEFDALAPRRGSDHTGVTDRVVNQLLTFLDGVEQELETGDNHNKQVYVIAATSRPDKVDPALLRPGRLETHVFVGYPQSEREWNDLFGRVIRSRGANVDGEIRDLAASGTLLNRVRSCTPQLRFFSAADMKAAMDTAHLVAVHEHLASSHTNDGGGDSDGFVVKICLRHLLRAIKATRPSLPPDDRLMLSRVYRPFMKHNNASDFENPLEGLVSPVGEPDGDVASGTFSSGGASHGEAGDDDSLAVHGSHGGLKTALR